MSMDATQDAFWDAAGRQLLAQLDNAAHYQGVGRWQVYEWLRSHDLLEPARVLRAVGDVDGASVVESWAHPMPCQPVGAVANAFELSRLRGDHLTLVAAA